MGAQNQQPGAQEALQQALAELATVKQKLASVSSDRERLREKSADQAKEIARQAEEIAGQAKEIVGLREQLDSTMRQLELLKRLLFGPKSERYVAEPDPNQYNLFEEPEAEEPPPASPDEEAPSKPKQHPKRRSLEDIPEGIPVEEVYVEPEEDTSQLQVIGEEVSWYYDIVPAKVKVVKIIRRKYTDPADPDRGVIIADLPPRLIDGGNAGEGLLAHAVCAKFVDHMPLYRQAKWFRRHGVDLSDSTLGHWNKQVAWNLEPLYEALKKQVQKSRYLQVDETTMPVQDRNKKGSTHRGYVWTYLATAYGLMVMEYTKTRCRAGPEAMLADHIGALQTDGFIGYEGFDTYPLITTYACWAHARRYFHECRESDPEEAKHVLLQLQRLYAIERNLRHAPADHRCQVRQQRAKPILDALEKWLRKNPGLPKSRWGRAVRYSLKRWEKLTRYVDNGEVEIDNNLVENAIRPLALGRKNSLFSGSHGAAQRHAVVYSLLGTCLMHDVNPEEWLTDVLTRIPTHPNSRVDELLPHNWKELRQLRKAA